MAAKKKAKEVKMMRPRDTTSNADVCRLRCDNRTYGDHWILLDGDGSHSVTIATQKVGEGASEMVHIPRKAFNRMVDWYMRPQKTRKA